MTTELIFDVNWEGPFYADGLGDVSEECVLYMICGTHGLYGRNVPLHIGRTAQRLADRLRQHDFHWLYLEPDPVMIYAGYVGEFVSWEHNDKQLVYPRLPDKTIDAIESLLIFAHQPVYNSRTKKSAVQTIGNIRLFNTGRRSTLYPEVSSLYWISSPAAQVNEGFYP